MTTRYRELIRPALETCLTLMGSFLLMHMLLLSWVPSPIEEGSAPPPTWARMLGMLIAPLAVGIPFAVVAALLNALAWKTTKNGPLESWRYGLPLALAPVPPILLAATFQGNNPGATLVIVSLLSTTLAPAIIGLLMAGRRGLIMGVAALPFLLWTPFIGESGFRGWVAAFDIALVLILGLSGLVMAKNVDRATLRRFKKFADP